jgi:uncharacterized paraquat-inducible protein A
MLFIYVTCLVCDKPMKIERSSAGTQAAVAQCPRCTARVKLKFDDVEQEPVTPNMEEAKC